ncbi:MAG: MerR family transcriptional regulator, partial [Lentihominibacter sp.]
MQTFYSIGEVHQMTGFSVPALRYYADMGIIVPEKVDTQTGYRYYSFDDIRRLETVG